MKGVSQPWNDRIAVADETLREKQSRFAMEASRLIQQAFQLGFEVTLGEAWRTPEQAQLNAQKGIGITNSLHIERLAIDLNLFKDGMLITDDEGHRDLGAWWISQSQDHYWGGNFKPRPDPDHYSISPDGGHTK